MHFRHIFSHFNPCGVVIVSRNFPRCQIFFDTADILIGIPKRKNGKRILEMNGPYFVLV